MIIDVHAHYIPASLADNEKFSDLFYVKEDTMDEPEEISMEELTAYDRNLGIGDQVIIGPDETLFPLDMAENLGMFDEIDPLSQISETDPRQWQMEWMDNYMDALEELEDSTTRE